METSFEKDLERGQKIEREILIEVKKKYDDALELLMCTDEKLEYFENHDIDYVWMIPFNEDF